MEKDSKSKWQSGTRVAGGTLKSGHAISIVQFQKVVSQISRLPENSNVRFSESELRPFEIVR